MPTVAAAVVSLLAEAGSRRFYTVPGESFLELLDQVEQDPRTQLISTRHESGASFMAEADGRLTGAPAVALASRAPGATNLAIGVETARYDGTPLVAILGQVESDLLGSGAFQEIDLTAFYTPITKWAVTAERPGDVPGLVARGVEVATSGRPGPVAIAVPTDFWDAEVPGGAVSVRGATPSPADEAEVERLTAALAGARHPVAIAGGGAAGAGAGLVAVAEHFGLGVYVAFRRQDMFPSDHPHFLGHLGIGTPPELLAALDEADLILLVGTGLDEVTSQGFRYPRPGCSVHRIGIDTSRAGRSAGEALSRTLSELCKRDRPDRDADWSAGHQAAVRFGAAAEPAVPGAGLHPAQVVAAVRRRFADGAIITNDAGNFAAFLHRYWRFGEDDIQLGPAIGAMGYAVPAAVAAKLARPERPVVAFVGDGGALMTGQEIETAARTGAGIVVVAFHNQMYGTIAMHQAKRFGRTAATGIGEIDLAAWARGLGVAAYTAADPAELDTALTGCDGERPVLIDVRTDPDIISPTARLSELTGAVGGKLTERG